MIQKTIVFIAALVVSACNGHNWQDSVITNTSEFPVSCKFTNTETLEIPAGGAVTFETAAYQRLEYYAPDKRVAFGYTTNDDGYTGTFTARQSWTVTAHNTLSEAAVLTADGWMDDLEIASGAQETGAVYTAEPVFSVSAPQGAAILLNKSEDEDGVVTFQVTIR